ncbi:hypothetical protein AEA09_08675 [Lysinibacillus contaminans]|uniref:Alpha-ribazole phosphatase n=1 Tax=Lysinibacillus contaminans TaxID=1293441 RepID=A0ABR5K131_9BACI|nr:histidine phosphatase family protein [Lysinibacillus contaminans]KOS68613.1 hypothetical protein AEA09_08675 [Lysinibacillus contaminans]
MGDVVTVRLMRHAPTRENIEKRYLGWTNAPLLDDSVLPEVDLNVTKVYGSDLMRCQQTAARYFPLANYVPETRFRESNFGDFEGKTYDELKSDDRYCEWLDNPVENIPPNGEGFDTFCARVIDGFLALPKEEQDYVLVVHGGVIRTLLVHFAPEEKPFWSYDVPHHVMFTLIFSQKAWKEGARCMSLSVVPIMGKPTM